MIDTLWLIIGGIGAAGLVLWRVFIAGRKSQRQETALQAAERMAKAEHAGRKGAAEATENLDKGKTPEQIVRENDGRWK